ncbi:MAG: rhodanese-like domain-containing protein [Ignavibacteriae bacterium]|nr:MAG: rhodanese-like domain-containing protein [Ignavibacteriota bacterium]
MTTTQILLYAGIVIALLYYAKQAIQRSRMKQYSASEVAKKLKDSSVLLLDVRTKNERDRGSIQGSMHIPLGTMVERLNTLEKYKEKEIICFCQSGSRSRTAVSLLTKNGFHAVNMKGGIAEWNYRLIGEKK